MLVQSTKMLNLRLCLVISTLLVLSHQTVIENSFDATISDTDIEKNLNETGNHQVQPKRELGKRRTPIWFAVPRESPDNTSVIECTSSSDEFPNLFTPEQRENGAIVLHFIICTYCFILVAIICDNYFIPCVEQICEALNLSEDVAAATFMAIATSAPELFVNIIGTFITNSDIGIGTIVGSSMFNTIGVASIGGLAASYPIKIAWWPVTRDIILYVFAVMILVVMTWDGNIFWYEALVLFCGYFLYFVVMIQNDRISRAVHALALRLKPEGKQPEEPVSTAKKMSISTVSSYSLEHPRSKYTEKYDENEESPSPNFEIQYNIYRMPKGGRFAKAFFIVSWPIRFMLYYTIPDCRKYPRFFPLTFVVCIVWIGMNSYVISWLMSIIGATFGIPDAILGLTFLAVGGCLPEAFSIAILSRKGEGRMGVSNALGANTMNILLSLGLPWFIKTLAMGADDTAFISIESGSLEYTIIGLIVVALTLYFSLIFTNFHLSRLSGALTLACYFGFLTLAIIADLVLFESDCI